MPRRPEIGNVQLYPNRPLRESDRNGYVLKFYCPIVCKRVRKNCGTRDRRDARRIQRECQERLLNGEYAASGGAISHQHTTAISPQQTRPATNADTDEGKTWQECYERYRQHLSTRVRDSSWQHSLSRIAIAERIFECYQEDRGMPEGLLIRKMITLDMLEYLQDRLLAGDECRYDVRSPNTVNSMLGAVMAFVRFCHKHDWLEKVPAVQKLEVDDVMKGRPITTEEFERMLAATSKVVGASSAASWEFALHVLWESGFRVGDLMDFSWDEERHIHPVWPTRKGVHPTIVIPSTQKNGRWQEIPMLPGLQSILAAVPENSRQSWVVNPLPLEYEIKVDCDWFRPVNADLKKLVERYSNSAIARACGVSETTVRNWLTSDGIERSPEARSVASEVSAKELKPIKERILKRTSRSGQRQRDRLTKERVSRVISLIGKEAGVVVRKADGRTIARDKFASAHDLRRGCAMRLMNSGVSAETLKVVMRHADFATTEKHYGALRSAQAAADEVQRKLAAPNPSFVGGLVGGKEEAPQLSAEELLKLKSLLNSL